MSSTILNLKEHRFFVLCLILVCLGFFAGSRVSQEYSLRSTTFQCVEQYQIKSGNDSVEVKQEDSMSVSAEVVQEKSKHDRVTQQEKAKDDLVTHHEIENDQFTDHVITKDDLDTENSTDLNKFTVDNRGFWKGLGAVQGHLFDEPLANAIVNFFQKENISTVLELGAGMGLYAKKIQSETHILISCYDGNPQTQDLSEGRCGVADFSKKLQFSRHHWVLSLEVGEHIPKEFENIFLGNIDSGNSEGAIVSWAVEGQGGTSHVNNHNNDYIRVKMSLMGYKSDPSAETELRSNATYEWFKNTIMVFRK